MKRFFLTLAVIGLWTISIAQPPPPAPQPIPIDGGLGFLAAGALALAAKKMFSKGKKDE